MPHDVPRLRIEEGAELVGALRRLPVRDSDWLSAVGAVADAELRAEGADGGRRVSVRGPATIASLGGPAGGPWAVVLARTSGTGVEVLAGELVRARSSGVTVAALPAQAAAAEPESPTSEPPEPARAADLAPARGARASSRGVAPSVASSWGAAALESAERAGPAEATFAPPARGDYVNHFAFGLCEVLRATGSRLDIRDARGTGRVREIALELLEVAPPTERNGRRTFRLTKRA